MFVDFKWMDTKQNTVLGGSKTGGFWSLWFVQRIEEWFRKPSDNKRLTSSCINHPSNISTRYTCFDLRIYLHTYNNWFRSDTGVWSSVVEHDLFKFANYISKSCCRIIPPAGRMVFNCCCPAHYEPHFGVLSTIRPNHLVSSHWLNQTQLFPFVWLHEWLLYFSPLLPYHTTTEKSLEKLTPLWVSCRNKGGTLFHLVHGDVWPSCPVTGVHQSLPWIFFQCPGRCMWYEVSTVPREDGTKIPHCWQLVSPHNFSLQCRSITI